MAKAGFNVGSIMSLNDMGLAINYLADKDVFEPDLQNLKGEIYGKQKDETFNVKKPIGYEGNTHYV